ncbi:carbohydrate esterase family 12 protein, partial [Aplosporella prunicola CBS 121167]
QFGHNDQKASSGVSLEQYTANLERFVAEVGDVGAHALLVTPLSRRSFDSADPPRVVTDLTDQREATLSVATNTGTPSIDLNQASVDYLNAIGPDDAHTYNLESGDNTHLNDAGGVVFGNMVSWLMGQSVSDLSQGTQPNAEYATHFENGEYFYPDV